MAYDGIVTCAMAHELHHTLQGGRIEKIYQPEREELVLLVRTKTGRHKVYLSCAGNHCGIYLSQESYTNPPQPSGFCMLLRKHLQGGVILSVTQPESERIIEISVDSYDELGLPSPKRLLVEIMGRHSNLVLISEKDRKVLDAAKRLGFDTNRARQLLPGLPYEYPPTQEKIPFSKLTEELLLERLPLGSQRDPADALLSTIGGISPLVARELCLDLDAQDPQVFIPGVLRRLASIQGAIDHEALTPCVYLREDGSPADFHVLPLRQYEGMETLSFDTISDTVAWFYAHRASSNRIRQKGSDLIKALKGAVKKQRLKKQRLLEDLEVAEGGDVYRLYGELLTAYIGQCQTGDKAVTVTNYYDGQPLTIPLDIRFSPAKNAQTYYHKYAKSKIALKEKKIQLEETERDIAFLESALDLCERAETVAELEKIRDEVVDTGFLRQRGDKKGQKKKAGSFQPHAYKSSAGLDILAGHNNRENDHLTFKLAGRNDVWLHTKDIPGSHVILFARGTAPDEASLREAAQVAAFHSKGRYSQQVPVDYTKVRYVKKPNGAKPGMVIFTENRTVYVTPGLPEAPVASALKEGQLEK